MPRGGPAPDGREWVARAFTYVEAEVGDLLDQGPEVFRHAMLELGLLTVMVLALVAAVVLLRRRAPGAAAEKA